MSNNDETASASKKQEEIDAILNAALDELDEDDNPPLPAAHTPQQEQPSAQDEQMGHINDMLKQLFDRDGGIDNGDETFGSIMMEEMQKHIKAEMERENLESGGDVNRTISKLVEDMASMGTDTEPDGEQQMMEEMMKEFEKLSGGSNADDMIEGMMGQLLSKDLMYEPMKQVSERFPDWLQENRSNLSDEEYTNRCKQHDCFRKLIYLYETQPNNTEGLMTLMQEVQEYGQPPSEIVKAIAPGLELDEEGVPKMDFLNGNEECRIM